MCSCDSLVAVLREQVGLDAGHERAEPLRELRLLVARLLRDHLRADAAELFLVEQYQPQQRPGHGPLVAAVLEHYHV